jgi:hypothetical protein
MSHLHGLPEPASRRRWWLIFAIVCGAAGFILTGIRPFYQDFPSRDDFAFVYHGSQAMHLGSNGPYFHSGDVYPPGAMLFFYPLSYLPQIFASSIVLWLSAALYLAGVWFLGKKLLQSGHELRFTVLVVLSLLWGPALAGFHSNNVSLIVIGLLLLLATGCMPIDSWAFPVVLGIALSLKPQLGVLFLLYLLSRTRWSALWKTLFVTAIVTIASLAWIWVVEPNWLADYRQEQADFNSLGGWGDVTYGSTSRFVLINLQVAIYPWVHHVGRSRLIGAFIAAILVVIWIIVDRKARQRPNEFLALASLLPISLIGVFQQFYNGALLVLCLAATLTLRRSRGSWIAFLVLCFFLVRPAPIYKRLPSRFLDGGVPSIFWNSFGVGFSAWLTFITCVVMLWLYWRWSRGKETLVAGL